MLWTCFHKLQQYTANIGHTEKSVHRFTVIPLHFLHMYNCCSKKNGKTVSLKYSDLLCHLHLGIVLCMVNNCAWYSKPLYFRLTVFTCVFIVTSLYFQCTSRSVYLVDMLIVQNYADVIF